VELRIEVPGTPGGVSGLLLRPADAHALLVLAHGAGAGMRHAFMEAICDRLASHKIATLRYQFPYLEAGGRRPDRPALATATVRAAASASAERADGLPVFAGGRSFGGRMTSTAAASTPLPGVRGLVFVGFPLHASRKPDTRRAEHLSRVGVPMLFLQGTRDTLAELPLLTPICEKLAQATLHVVEGADHSFHVLKRSGRSDDEVLSELAGAIDGWMRRAR
jgi:predicted alpha/beta-hydrolase family hydrolase